MTSPAHSDISRTPIEIHRPDSVWPSIRKERLIRLPISRSALFMDHSQALFDTG